MASQAENFDSAEPRSGVIFLMGPTASGKTSLAMQIADRLPVRLISVDATQVYRELDIGSAKPDRETLQRYPHRLIDIRDPAQSYSVAEFVEDARREIRLAHEDGVIPLLVGGTMLYYRALLDGLAETPPVDPELRNRIEQEAEELGWPEMHRQLVQVDPQLAEKLHPNHSQRIQRGLEVFRQTGKPLSSWQTEQSNRGSFEQEYRVLQVALVPEDRAQLHQQIEHRFKQMVANGLLGEVEKLFSRGDLTEKLPAVRAVGYRQAWKHLTGELGEDWIDKAIIATRQLSKRQMTWLRQWPAQRFDPYETGAVSAARDLILKQV